MDDDRNPDAIDQATTAFAPFSPGGARPPGAAPTTASFTVPDRLGPYRLVRELGRGGMGIVFEAQDEALDRAVAVKVLGPWLSGRESAARRFESEARVLARLQHPGIVQVLAAARAGDLLYFAMELVRGESLDRQLARDRLPTIRVLQLGIALAEALTVAHAHDIVHRDFKPGNVLIDEGGSVKISDFGLSRWSGDDHLTATGALVGTPTYMAPEVLQGETAAPPADVYALGVVLYEMLAGRPPFRASSPFAVANLHVNAAPPDVRGLSPQAPKALADLVMRLLAKAPADRPAIRDVERLLRKCQRDHTELEGALHPLLERAGLATPRPDGSTFRSAWGVVLFADIVGFTPIAEAAAPELVGRFLEEIFTAMRAAVEGAGGLVEKFIGDCCLAVFVAPEPRAAVAASLEATLALHAAGQRVATDIGLPFKLRCGMNAGDFLIGPVHDGRSFKLMVLGDTVNFASKIESAYTKAGETCAGQGIVPFLPDGWRAEKIAVHERTKSPPLEVFRLTRATAGTDPAPAAAAATA